jgi:tRNA threonylcarbamoyl adenosine modification protein YeaZ
VSRERDGRRRAILAIDTATSEVIIGVGSPEGEPEGLSRWPAGYRHGDQLLPSIGRLLGEANLRRSRLDGIVVGTGPGAFTGLRVGLATAKALAHALGRPIAGVSTAEALIAAAAAAVPADPGAIVLLLPAGPNDRVLARHAAPPERLPAGTEPQLADGEVLVAVDLDGRAPEDAVARGARARERLGHELLRLGAERLRAGGDDLERLVPEYVTLPRGVSAAVGEVSWSRDPR